MGFKITEKEPTSKKVVGTQISLELYEKLQQEAQDNFMSISDLIRKLIIVYYREKEDSK